MVVLYLLTSALISVLNREREDLFSLKSSYQILNVLGLVLFLLLYHADFCSPSSLSLSESSCCDSDFSSSSLRYSATGSSSKLTLRRFFCLGTGLALSFSKCNVRPLEPTWVSFEIILTRNVRHGVQIVPPLFVDLDCGLIVGLTIGSKPLFVCMGNHLADILGVDSVQDCHEVGSVR